MVTYPPSIEKYRSSDFPKFKQLATAWLIKKQTGLSVIITKYQVKIDGLNQVFTEYSQELDSFYE